MSDCRLILDNISDMASLKGPLVTGSDAIDISSAQMALGADGWKVLIKTVAPAVQNPRLSVTVALYLDVDGRMENNATVAPGLNADTIYGLSYNAGAWKLIKETVTDAKANAFTLVPTKATYSIGADGYTLNIPYAEVAKTAPAYWKAGIVSGDAARLTVDYVPDTAMACTPSLAPRNGLADFVTRAKNAWNMGLNDEVFVGAVVLAALVVVFYKWKKARNKKS